jgi:hypothetical protein
LENRNSKAIDKSVIVLTSETKTDKKQLRFKSFIKRLIRQRYLIVGVAILLVLPFVMVKGEIKRYMLNQNSESTKAVVINEKNYIGNDNFNNDFTYSYEFVVKDEKYVANSLDGKLKVGDSVLVEYVPIYPNFNRIRKR